jgi:hypothetical protein
MKNENIFFTDKSEIGLIHKPITPEPKKFWSGAKVGEYKDITDIAKAVREFVKTKYPKSKFSVTTEKYSGGRSLSVTLMSAPFNPIVDDKFWSVSTDNKKYYSINQFYIETSEALSSEAKKVFSEIREFYNQFNYNNSDPQTDYFSVGFYETLAIGRWDKGFEQTASKSKTPAPKRTPNPLPEKGGSEAKYNIGDKVNYKTSKGSEDGIVKRVKYVASKTAYLYTVTNPRGGDYNIWESNILFKIFGEKPEPKFKVGQTVKIKGRSQKYIIKSFSLDSENEFVYEGEYTETGDLFPLFENLIELSKDDMPENPNIIINNLEIYPELLPELTFFETLGFIEHLGNGWRLPTEEELRTIIYPNKSNIPFVNKKVVWSSTDVEKKRGEDLSNNVKIFAFAEAFGKKGITSATNKNTDQYGIAVKDIYKRQPQPTPTPEPTPKEENSSLSLAIDELKETNDLLWEMYIDSDDNVLKKELRLSANDNSFAINEFSADLFFDPEKFLNNYFERATEKIAYDNTELSKEEFKKITNSNSFKNWFGDFTDNKNLLNDKLVSKVLKTDLNPKLLEPLIVYHGTWNKSHFSRFKFNKFPIIYFASNKSYAEWFANIGTGIIYECFLDIKFLCDFRILGLGEVTWSELSDFLQKKYGVLLPQSNTNKKTYVWDWIRKDAPEFKLINTIKEFGFTGMAHIENNPQDKLPNGDENTTTAYMIFKPEQAKLVRYVESSNAFTDILFMKKGGSIKHKKSLLDEIKNLKF